MRLRVSLAEPTLIVSDDRDRMFQLMQACYENLDRQQFDADLNQKWLVIQVYDPATEQLVGFSTQVVIHTRIDGRMIRALYSGDTVMAPEYWGDMALANAWGRLALQLIDEAGSEPLYWFLTSKGFRTYRYLPLFFRQFSPRHGSVVSVQDDRLIAAFGRQIAGDAYDHQHRIIRADPQKYFTRARAVDPGLRVHHDAHVRYFVEQNPSYARGDELCCLAPLSRDNFTRLAYRVIDANAACKSTT